jgi:UDP-N-acetylmuramoylalanine-D-glutamate ligase
VGGQDRGIEHGLLGDAVRRRMFPTLLVALHSNGDAILEAVRSQLADRPAAAAVELAASVAAANDPAGLRAATEHAVAWARQHAAVVLLSPAAPSFDHFRDYRDRSAQFAAIAGPLLQ